MVQLRLSLKVREMTAPYITTLPCPTKHIKNTSRQPDDEIHGLIAIALNSQDFPIDMSTVAINVKKYGYSATVGRAYSHVPSSSPWRHTPGVKNLLVVRVLAEGTTYPKDNLISKHTTTYATPWLEDNEYAKMRGSANSKLTPEQQKTSWTKMDYIPKTSVSPAQYLYRLAYTKTTRTPYGGKKSPVIVCNNWQEYFVTVVAHEMWHVVQFRAKKRMWEYQCEIAAQRALAFYRDTVAGVESVMLAAD